MLSLKEFHKNRIEKAMQLAGADVIIASVPQHILYLTGFVALGATYHAKTQNYAVYSPAKKQVYIINSVSDSPTAFSNCPEAQLVCHGPFRFSFDDPISEFSRDFAQKIEKVSASPAASIIEVLNMIGVGGSCVAWDELRTPFTTWNAVTQKFPNTKFIPGLPLFEEARCIKHPDEIAKIEKAAIIAEDSLVAALNQVRLGDSEYDINRAYCNQVTQRNGEVLFCTATIDRRSSFSDTESTKTQLVRDGSIMRFDYGATYEFYCSDLARTAMVGKRTPSVEYEYACILEGLDRAIAFMKPGVTAKEVFAAALAGVQRGLPNFSRHHCGHGIGLLINDIPGISPSSDRVLEEGMVFCIETPHYVMDSYGIQIEDMVAVSKNGTRRLCHTSNDLIYLDAK